MSTVRSTAPGQRANRRSCSAGAAQVRERRGRQPAVDLVERTARRAPPRARSRADGATAWRSARCWWRPPRHRVASRPARARRCGGGRADRRGPTARRAPGRGRTRRPARASACSAAAGPSRCKRGGHRALAATGEHEPVVVARAARVPSRCTGARAASASCASDVRGAPFSPASCASLIAFASRAYPTGPCASTIRCSPGGSAHPVRRAARRAERQLGAEHRRQRRAARAASANRTTP